MLDSKYHIVTPAPKPKVKVALYAFKRKGVTWRITAEFYPDDKSFENVSANDLVFKRLDWSEMEVDE